jgi:hypothetical protein
LHTFPGSYTGTVNGNLSHCKPSQRKRDEIQVVTVCNMYTFWLYVQYSTCLYLRTMYISTDQHYTFVYLISSNSCESRWEMCTFLKAAE